MRSTTRPGSWRPATAAAVSWGWRIGGWTARERPRWWTTVAGYADGCSAAGTAAGWAGWACGCAIAGNRNRTCGCHRSPRRRCRWNCPHRHRSRTLARRHRTRRNRTLRRCCHRRRRRRTDRRTTGSTDRLAACDGSATSTRPDWRPSGRGPAAVQPRLPTGVQACHHPHPEASGRTSWHRLTRWRTVTSRRRTRRPERPTLWPTVFDSGRSALEAFFVADTAALVAAVVVVVVETNAAVAVDDARCRSSPAKTHLGTLL